MGSIYKITNTVNGKSYIGKTTRDAVKTRIRDHLRGKGSQPVKDAIEKYGQDAFTYEILHDGIIPEFLDDLEKEVIAKFNTVSPHGYNLTEGGDGGSPSKETRRKFSEAQKGRVPWNKGKREVQKHSEATRQQMSQSQKTSPLAIEARKKIAQSNLGTKRTPETKAKISEKAKIREAKKRSEGYTVSEAARRKMSETRKGKNNPMYGKSPSEATRRKMSIAKKGKPLSSETRRKISQVLRGHKVSEATRRKISAANIGKKRSAEDRRKMSEANKNRSPYRAPARAFFDTLPSDMNLKDKRLYLYDEFPSVKKKTIQKWVRQWQSEKRN